MDCINQEFKCWKIKISQTKNSMRSNRKYGASKHPRIQNLGKGEDSTQSAEFQITKRRRRSEEESLLNISYNQQIQSCLTSTLKTKPKKKLVEWTSQEDKLLFQKYAYHGSKWVQIAELFPTKNDNDIKNRFYSCIRKVVKRINHYQNQKKDKFKKMVGFESLLTILEVGKFNKEIHDGRFIEIKKNIDEILQVASLIIGVAYIAQSQISDQMIEPLVQKLTNLKYSLKFINIERVKKSAVKSSEVQTSGSQKIFRPESPNEKHQPVENISIKQKNLNTEEESWMRAESEKQLKANQNMKNLIQCFSQILDQSLVQNEKKDLLSFML